MNPEIEHRKAFTVAGIQASIKQGSETAELFAGIWEKFEVARNILENLSVTKKYYGINFPTEKEGISEYIAGMMVPDNSQLPDGLVMRNVPESDYAIFECPVDSIGLTYQNIFSKWLQGASVSFYPKNPVFEEYPEKYSTFPVRVHIPII